MPIVDFNTKYLFRMTHIENIEHIIRYGITHRNSVNANANYKPIGDSTLISTRNSYILTNGKSLGEYIPFYFGTRTPMLYVISKGFNGVSHTPSENIVYCVTSVQQVLNSNIDFVFTNGHAVDSFSKEFSKEHINDIDTIVDYNAINSKFWKDEDDLDKKRRKEAELLLERDLPPNLILGYICYNQNAKYALLGLNIAESKIVIKPNYYF